MVNKNGGSEAPAAQSRRYTRFPRLSIEDILQFPKKIMDEGHDLKKDRLCGLLDRSPTSGTTRTALGAARAYALIRDTAEGYISPTDLGRQACSTDPHERVAAFAEATSNVEEFRRFLDHFSESKVPSEGVAEDYLTSSMEMKPAEAKVFYRVVMQNARDAGLTEMLPGGEFFRSVPRVVPTEELDEELDVARLAGAAPMSSPEPVYDRPQPAETAKRSVEMHFNIQIHLPESTDSEVYDAIFRSMRENLIGD